MSLSKLQEIVKDGELVCCGPWGYKESDRTEQLNDNKNVEKLAFKATNLSPFLDSNCTRIRLFDVIPQFLDIMFLHFYTFSCDSV